VASLAHPGGWTAIEARLLAEACAAGTAGNRAYHSDPTSPAAHYLALAREHGLAVTADRTFTAHTSRAGGSEYAAGGTTPGSGVGAGGAANALERGPAETRPRV